MKNSETKNGKNGEVIPSDNNGDLLFCEISEMIEESRRKILVNASGTTVLLFWRIGRRINLNILDNKRADYGKKIVPQLATQLTEKYGRSFEEKNLRRMLQFAEQFLDEQIVVTLSRQLSWSHFLVLIPLKTTDAKLYYAGESMRENLGVRALRNLISRKAYERKEIADTQITSDSKIPPGTFKDPYLFDVLGIKDEYMEADLEEAILRELEKFILEFGKGLTFFRTFRYAKSRCCATSAYILAVHC